MKLLLPLLLALMLSACANPPNGCTRLSAEGWYCPAFVSWPEFSTEQATTVRFRGQAMQLLTRVQSDRDGVRLVTLSPLGQTLINAAWQQGKLSVELPPGLAGKVDPRLIPALLEVALAPCETVRAGLGGGLSLKDSEGRRSISSSRGEVILINWRGTALPYEALRIDVPGLGLSIDSHTIEQAP